MQQNYHKSGRKYELLLILVLLSALSVGGVLNAGSNYYDDTGVQEDNWDITFTFLDVYVFVSVVLCIIMFSNLCCNCLSFQVKIVLLVLLTVLMFANATIVAIRASEYPLFKNSNYETYDSWLTVIAIILFVAFIITFIVLILNLCDKYFYYTQANNVPYPNAIQMNPQTDRYLNNN